MCRRDPIVGIDPASKDVKDVASVYANGVLIGHTIGPVEIERSRKKLTGDGYFEVKRSSDGFVYQEGIDYIIDMKTGKLSMVDGSRMSVGEHISVSYRRPAVEDNPGSRAARRRAKGQSKRTEGSLKLWG